MWHLINLGRDGIKMKKKKMMVVVVMMMVIIMLVMIILMIMNQKGLWKCLLLKKELALGHTQYRWSPLVASR